MSFGKYLEEIIRKREISINNLTKLSGVNRGKLYSVFESKRTLNLEELFALINNLGFLEIEVRNLLNLYFEEMYGKTEFSNIKFLEEVLQKENLKIAPDAEDENTAFVNASVVSGKEIDAAVKYIIQNDNGLITNFPVTDKEMDRAVFSSILKTEQKSFVHMIEFSCDANAMEIFDGIFISLKYCWHNYFPLYCYSGYRKAANVIFPYYFAGERYALLFNEENGIWIDNADTAGMIRTNAEKAASECKSFGVKPDDIMFVKDLYEKSSKSMGNAFSITYYPCLAQYVDFDFMHSITRDELPDKEMLARVAYEYYAKLFQFTEFRQITSIKGIEWFAETGCVQEVPAAYVHNADKHQRVKVLKNLVNGIEKDELYILDEEKISILPGMEIENYHDKFVISGYDICKENFSSTDRFIISFEDRSVINVFNNFMDYIIKSQKVYSKEFSVRLVESLIVKLQNEMETDSGSTV